MSYCWHACIRVYYCGHVLEFSVKQNNPIWIPPELNICMIKKYLQDGDYD